MQHSVEILQRCLDEWCEWSKIMQWIKYDRCIYEIVFPKCENLRHNTQNF